MDVWLLKLLTSQAPRDKFVDKIGVPRQPGLKYGSAVAAQSRLYATRKEEACDLYAKLSALSIIDPVRKYLRVPFNPQGLRIPPRVGYAFQATKFPRLKQVTDLWHYDLKAEEDKRFRQKRQPPVL